MSLTFSEPSVQLLKNFAEINTGLAFKEGHVLRTVSPQKTILVETTIDEAIPGNFCIHDMNSFLSVLSLHKETPKLEFDEKNIFILAKNGRSKITYRCCDESVIITPPNKNLELPSADIHFLLTEEDFKWIMKSASVLQSPHIAVLGNDTTLSIKTMDAQNDSAHTDTLEIGPIDGTMKNFQILFKTENWKMIPGEYDVTISAKGFSMFKHTSKKLVYWIAIEAGSKK